MAYRVLGEWVDVDNQLACIAPVLATVGVWVRFMRDSGTPPRLGVVNPQTRPFSIRAEVTAVPHPDGPGWVFLYHPEQTPCLPLVLGTDVKAAAVRVAHLLGVMPL